MSVNEFLLNLKDKDFEMKKFLNVGDGNEDFCKFCKILWPQSSPSLTDFVTRFEKDDFNLIKINANGYELDIINREIEIIKKTKVIIVRVSLKQAKERCSLIDDVVEVFKNLKFQDCFEIEDYVYLENLNLAISVGDVYQKDLAFLRWGI